MKLNRVAKGRFQFQLGEREKELLLDILKLYPRIPSAHLRVSKTPNLPEAQASQKLLDEALAEQRAENKRHLERLLDDPARWGQAEDVVTLSLSEEEIEWLVQVLNDIRVGSWVRLGSPEERLEVIDEHTAPLLWAMELAGFYQMCLVHGLEDAG